MLKTKLSFIEIFETKGEKINLSESEFFDIRSSDYLFLLKDLDFDLFVSIESEEKKENKNIFLCSISQEIICGFDTHNSNLVKKFFIKPSKSSIIYQISFKSFFNEINNELEIKHSLNNFIVEYYRKILKYFYPAIALKIYPEDIFLNYEKEKNLLEKRLYRILISQTQDSSLIEKILVTSGSISLIHHKNEYSTGSCFPVFEEILIYSNTSSSIILKPCENNFSFKENLLAISLQKEIIKIVQYVCSEISFNLDEDYLKKILYKKNLSKKIIQDACELWNKNPFHQDESNETDLFTCCKIIGSYVKINFKSPKRSEVVTLEKELNDICETSSVAYRIASIYDGWHKDVGEFFLGFYEEEQRPVAILASKLKHYLMFDPKTKKIVRVNDEIAKKISKDVYIFYPMMIDTNVKFIHLVKNGFLKYCRSIVRLGVMSIIGALIGLFAPIASEQIINQVIPDSDLSTLIFIGIGLIVSAIVGGIFVAAQATILVRAVARFVRSNFGSIIKKIFDLPTKFFYEFTDIDPFRRALFIEVIHLTFIPEVMVKLIGATYAIVYFIGMLFFSWSLSLITLIIFGIGIYLFTSGFKKARDEFVLMKNKNALGNQTLKHLAINMEKIRKTASEDIAREKWSKIYWEWIHHNYLMNKRLIPMQVFIGISSLLTSWLVYWIIFENSSNSHLFISLGTFIGFSSALSGFIVSMNGLFSLLPLLSTLAGWWKRALPVIQTPSETVEKTALSETLKGNIRVRNLFFRYRPGDSLNFIDINLNISSKEHLVIFGKTASGKTTLAKIFLGLLPPSSGSILYDDKSLSQLNRYDFCSKIGYIPEDRGIILGTILDNVRVNTHASRAKVEQILDSVGLKNRIDTLPKSLDTPLEMLTGAPLNQFEVVCLMIARSMIKKPIVLIIDDPTIGLKQSEKEIVGKLIKKQRCTTIIFTQDLWLAKQIKNQYTLHNGEIKLNSNF